MIGNSMEIIPDGAAEQFVTGSPFCFSLPCIRSWIAKVATVHHSVGQPRPTVSTPPAQLDERDIAPAVGDQGKATNAYRSRPSLECTLDQNRLPRKMR
jgi:hypothetical protein